MLAQHTLIVSIPKVEWVVDYIIELEEVQATTEGTLLNIYHCWSDLRQLTTLGHHILLEVPQLGSSSTDQDIFIWKSPTQLSCLKQSFASQCIMLKLITG